MHSHAATLQRKDGKYLLQFFDQLGAICQAGERIMMRQVEDLRLSFLPFRDVLESRDPPATLHGLFDHAKRMRARRLHDPGAECALARLGDTALEKLLWIVGKLSRRFSALEQVEQGSTLELF